MDEIERHYDNLVEDHLIDLEDEKFPHWEHNPPWLVDSFDFDEV